MAKKASDILKNIGQGVYDFLANIGYLNRPIGIVGKNYDYIYRTLNRNIGNGMHEYDGYATPIGSLADVEFNLRTIPWFLRDTNKNQYSNYFNYIRGVYSDTSNLSPLDSFGNQTINFEDNSLAIVRGFDIAHGLDGLAVTNYNNGKNTDTELGLMNGFFLASTLDNAANVNTNRLIKNIEDNKGNITSELVNSLGLYDDNKAYILNQETIVPLLLESPLYHNNFGNYDSLGVYDNFYDSSSNTTQDFIEKSWTGTDLKTEYGYRGGKQKYYPELEVGHDYLSKTSIVSFNTNINGETIRYNSRLKDFEDGMFINKTIYTARNLYEYTEQGNGEYNSTAQVKYDETINHQTYNSGINYGSYSSIEAINTDTLIGKTNLNFQYGKYRTLISRFHTDNDDERMLGNQLQSAISEEYGMSMGRNLLRKNHKETHKDAQYNGYSNPYCRVWTYHHQYSRIADMIRPLSESGEIVTQAKLDETYHWKRFRSTSNVLDRETGEYIETFKSGGARLGDMGSKNETNGFVNITPIGVRGKNGTFNFQTETKNCMFSIENLAWKGTRGETFEDGLSEEQKGPFGGRIMWFPPYDISFNENVSVNWSPTSFIGRGENIYTYVNTERSGTLHFKLLIDHPAILDYWKGKGTHTKGDILSDGVDDVDSDEQTLLRFFAGCDILAPMETKKLKPQPIEPKVEPKPNPIVVEKRSIDKTFTFFVFYPNNYSGVDDSPTNQVSAMEYLVNGVGTQSIKTKSGVVEDFSTTNAELFLDVNRVGGYEMRLNDGISTVKTESAINRIISTVNYTSNGQKVDINLATTLNTKTKKEWYYRVDKRVSHEILRKGNYVDNDSFGLNSEVGYKELLPFYSGKVKEEELYSFSSVFVSLTDDYKQTLGNGLYNDDKVKELQHILSTYKIKEVNAMGVASSHGYAKSNNILNKNRAQSVVNWLKSKDIFKKQTGIEYKVKVTEIGNVGVAKSVSDKVPKAYRAAQIEVVYEVEELVNIQDTARETFESGNTTTRNTEPSYYQTNFLRGIDTPKLNIKSNSYNPFININGVSYDKATLTRQLPNDLIQKGGIEDMNKTLPPLFSQTNEIIDESGDNQINYRYDNEAEFFKLLETNDPFLHNKLVDKIKYFDPAFHSITPEGFNSRLTFLHQCTRQGSTVGASSVEKTARNANNLAFGRPPVCVLRVGDFYYTKIIIDSMSINYDPLVWDLNTEGIGVQPMIADIDISFKFIGGSDLAGPIARLQNAVSFNYYSNTGVYDNRSEMVKYDSEGKIIEFKGYK